MPDKPLPIGRIAIPDNLAPEGVVCVVFPAPNDPQYISMLIGIADMLRWSALYERDSTRTKAGTVQRVWSDALNSRPVGVLSCEEVDRMFDVRQNTDEPCTLEKTEDGETWLPWANIQLCPPQIQPGAQPDAPPIWWNPNGCGGVGCWEFLPLPVDQDEYNPAYDDPQRIIPDGWVTGGDERCAYAANVVEALKSIYERIDWGLYSAGLITVVWLEVILQVFMKLFSKGLRKLMEAVASSTVWSYAAWHADYIGFDWQHMVDILACAFSADGTVTANNFAVMMAQIDDEVLASPVWSLTKVILLIVGPVGMNNASDFAGITEATCTPDCELDLETCFEFTADDFGFENVGAYGEWLDTLGWHGTLNSVDARYEIDVHNDTPPAGTIDSMRVDWGTTASPKVFRVYNGATLIFEQLGGNAGARDATFAVGAALTDLRIVIYQGTYNTGLWLYSVCFYRA